MKDIKQNGDQGVKWTPDGALATSDTSITITYGGKTTTVSVTVKEPEVKEIKVTAPTTTSYTAGQFFDSTGMKVTASYTYGSDQQISISECDLTLTLPDNSTATVGESYKFEKAGDYTLTVSYEGVKAEIPLTVNFGTVTSITVSGPNKKEYELNETFDSTGLKVTAYDSYNNSKPVTSYTITDQEGKTVGDSYTFATVGSYTLTVTYTEGAITKTGTIIITVSEDDGYAVSEDGNTYTVYTASGLQAWNKAVQGNLSLNCTLTDDIDLKGIDWTPIGDYKNRYTGTFDGNGHTITGLTVNQKERDNVGLIGYLGSGGKVQNLTLENVNLNGNLYVGGVVGYSNNGTVTACTASGSINGKEYVGGIVGSNYLGTVTACYNTSSTVNGSYLVGGVVGQNSKGTVTACYNASGSIYGEVTVGGVVGDNYTGTVTACYNASGSIYGESIVGGVVGNNYTGTVTACYWSGSPDNDNGGATKVDGTTVTWQTAVDVMNAALQSANSEWRYEIGTGAPLTLKKQ